MKNRTTHPTTDASIAKRAFPGRARRLLHNAVLLLAIASVPAVVAQPAPEVYRERIEPNWLSNNTQFWYRNDNPGDTREFIFVDAVEGVRQPAFDHARVAEQIGDDVDPEKLPVDSLEFVDDGATIRLLGDNRSWTLDRQTGELDAIAATDSDDDGGTQALAFVRPSRNGGDEIQFTFENRLERAVALYWVNTDGDRITYGDIQPGQSREQRTFAGHTWMIAERDDGEDLAAFAATRDGGLAIVDADTPKPRERRRPGASREQPTNVTSPDERFEAFVRDHDLWIRVAATGEETRLSGDGTADHSYHRDAIRARAIGMNYDRADYPETLPEVHWSPDSTMLVALKTTVVEEPRVTLVESSPRDQVQPKLQSYPYTKPGGEVPQQEVRLFDVEAGREIEVDQTLFTNQWNLGRFRWERDSSRFTFLFNQRGHQVLRYLAVEPGGTRKGDIPVAQGAASRPSGSPDRAEVKVLIEEKADTFVDYSQKTHLDELDQTNELIWMSERDGWNHLYVFDGREGGLKRRLTEGEWMVRRVERLDEDAGVIWFWAMGVHADQDPYHLHLCRVDLGAPASGTPSVVTLTEGDGTHSIDWSPDNRFFIATWSRVDQPPVHELRDAKNGRLICELERAHVEKTAGYAFPEPFVAKGRDGETDIFGVIHRPKDFDSSKRYPVIESIYAGPHGAFVPKSFRTRYGHQELADRGFVVVQIDGMGTNWRGKKFHDVAWKNIKDAGYPDRIAWMKAAAETRPWMDLSRVGVYGGSAGGQNAMRAVLDHADFYKAAAADCGCHDNRMDKIWWNEAWMGLPGDGSYAKSSNVEDAHKLGGALLLTVGELDKNVDPSSTYQVVAALQRAGEDFEYMPIIGAGHGAGGSPFGRKLRADFFERHLKTK